MMPKDKNGVVDPTLKVYGTNNLRVVDLSIVPLHFAAHPQGKSFNFLVLQWILTCIRCSYCIRYCRTSGGYPQGQDPGLNTVVVRTRMITSWTSWCSLLQLKSNGSLIHFACMCSVYGEG